MKIYKIKQLAQLTFFLWSYSPFNAIASTTNLTRNNIEEVSKLEYSQIMQFDFDDNYQGEDNQKISSEQDPFENFNRKVFAINEIIDKNIALPIAKTYRKLIPKEVRSCFNNFSNNLMSPFSFVNSAIQGNGSNTMAGFSSFLINSTIGIGGLFDVAGKKNITYQREDFGQTLGRYGVKSGPYLILPILGPSDVRDFTGFAVEKFIDPMSINGLELGKNNIAFNNNIISTSYSALTLVSNREGLIEIIDGIRENSLDPYSTLRSAYLQRRQSLINNKL